MYVCMSTSVLTKQSLTTKTLPLQQLIALHLNIRNLESATMLTSVQDILRIHTYAYIYSSSTTKNLFYLTQLKKQKFNYYSQAAFVNEHRGRKVDRLKSDKFNTKATVITKPMHEVKCD